MVDVQRGLQVVTALLAVIGALFLSMGRDEQWLPLLAVCGAVAALVGTDFLGWLRLNRVLANMGAIAAVVWSLRDFFVQGQNERQLAAISEMLVYLQFVLLFQEKSRRLYWQLLVLSVLQAVVASAMNLGPSFGALLGLYFALAVFQMLMLCIQREALPHEGEPLPPPPAGDWTLLLDPPRSEWSPSRRPLLRAFHWTWFAPQAVGVLASTAAFAALFFYASPRHGEGAWGGPRSALAPITGFSPEVRLNGRGTLQPSKRIVLRVKFSQGESRQFYPLLDDPYLQGMVFNQYVAEDDDFRWLPHPREPRVRSFRPEPPRAGELVRMDAVLEPTRSSALFYVAPLHVLDQSSPRDARWNPLAGQLWRTSAEELYAREYRYAFGTLAFRGSRQLPATPHYRRLASEEEEQRLLQEIEELRSFDAARYPAIQALAEQALAAPELEGASKVRRLLALQDKLKLSSDFRYALDLGAGPPPGVDPLEHFVAVRKSGHCQLFASALVLMLRSQGIPARLVTGYKGGEYNAVGHYFVIREKHAHAWVEAYLLPEETPAELHAGSLSPAGAWYRLDPTPYAANESAAKSLAERLDDAFDYVEIMWRDYVLGFDANRQRETAFDPIVRPAGIDLPEWLEARRSPDDLERSAQRMFGELGAGPGRFPTLTLVAIAGLLCLAAVLARYPPPLAAWWRRWRGRDPSAGGPAVALGPQLWRRVQRQLARIGVPPLRCQTAGELQRAAEHRFSNWAPDEAAGGRQALALLVGAYEEIRFGGRSPTAEELARIEQALTHLGGLPTQNRPRSAAPGPAAVTTARR